MWERNEGEGEGGREIGDFKSAQSTAIAIHPSTAKLILEIKKFSQKNPEKLKQRSWIHFYIFIIYFNNKNNDYRIRSIHIKPFKMLKCYFLATQTIKCIYINDAKAKTFNTQATVSCHISQLIVATILKKKD